MSEQIDGQYTLEDEHVVKGQGKLIERFKHGPRNQAYVDAFLQEVQELENELWKLKNAYDVDTSVDVYLDRLGALVNEGRNGRLDAVYRAFIRVRVLVNESNGKPLELFQILDAMIPGVDVQLNTDVKTLVFELDSFGTVTPQDVFRELMRAKCAGTRLFVVTDSGDPGSIGSADGSPVGGTIGSADGSPAGFLISGVVG